MNDFEIKIIGQNFADKEPEIRVLINGIDDTAAAAVMRECARRQARYARERERERERESKSRAGCGDSSR